MQKTGMMAAATAAALWLLSPTHAVSGECASQLTDGSSVSAILACLKSQEAELNRLKDQATGRSVPSKAVVAFDIGDTDNCPSGWTAFASLNGRMIVGAGDPRLAPGKLLNGANGKLLTHYIRGQHGGDEKHALTEGQMPTHNHGIFHSLGEGSARPLFYFNEGGVNNKVSSPKPYSGAPRPDQGGNQPHNNMPPYLPLYYCKKD